MTRWKRNRKRDAENERWPSRQRAPRPPERFPEDLARPLLSTNSRRPAVHLARPRSRLQDLVDHVHQHYETDHIDIAIVTHPDQDHIGGMGRVLEGLNVDVLCVHRLRKHGGGELPAADAIDDLIKIAQDQGRSIHEPYAVSNAFGGALTVLAPDEAYYTQLVADQVGEERTGRRPPAGVPESSAPHGRRVIDSHRFYDQRFASKIRAGRIPATTRPSLDFLDRLLGPISDQSRGKAQLSVASQSVRHPSPRVANADMRRGYRAFETRGKTIHHFSDDAPDRPGWVPATQLPPMDESAED